MTSNVMPYLKTMFVYFFVFQAFNLSLVTDKDLKMSRKIDDLTKRGIWLCHALLQIVYFERNDICRKKLTYLIILSLKHKNL